MSNRAALPLLLITAACSGQLSTSSLLGGSSSSATAPTDGRGASAADASRGSDYDFTSPPTSADKDLVTMPKFFQASRMASAYRRSPWTGFWLADVLGDQLGEHARLRLVASCLGSNNDLQYAACITDAHRLDRKKLMAELAAPEAKPYSAAALETFDAVVKEVAERDAQIAKRKLDDPAFEQMFETIPRAVWTEWDRLNASHRALFALTRSLELQSHKRGPMDESPGPSRKAFAGCAEKLAPYFTKAVRTTKQSDPNANTFGTALTPFGYIATLAQYYCARGNDQPIAEVLGVELTEPSWLRGPRMATIERLIAKSKTLQFDDKSYSIDGLVWRDANYIVETAQLHGLFDRGHGVVKKVSRQGATLHVVFAKGEIEFPVCLRSERTGTWRYNRSTSSFEPVEVCVRWGSEKEIVDIEPIEIDAKQGAAIQPGRYVEWQAATSTERSQVAVLAVWDSAKQKKLLALFGVAR
jgi:hypothetical protein